MEASFILYNGRVFTAEDGRPWAQMVAVREGVIIGVGGDKEITKYCGANTQVIDVEGGTIIPGFIDAHMHPSIGAPAYCYEIVLNGVVGLPCILQTIEEFISLHPDLPVYTGYGFLRTDFDEIGPRAAWLDSIEQRKPIMISSIDGHSLWMNSVALELAQVTDEAVAAHGGQVTRLSATGEFAGLVKGLLAMKLFDKLRIPLTHKQYLDSFRWLFKRFHQEGLTAVFDAEISLDDLTVFAAYKELAKSDSMQMHVRGSWLLRPDMLSGIDEALLKARSLSDSLENGLFQMPAVKIFIDGIIEEDTAYLKEPYLHLAGEWRGKPVWCQGDLEIVCQKADALGFQIHVHCIGDAATASVVSAIKRAGEINGPKERNHQIAHLQLVDPEDMRKMGDLGIGGIVAPQWACIDEGYLTKYLPSLGEARARQLYPMQSLLKSGVSLAAHSDFNVSDPELDLALYGGMTRTIAPGIFAHYYGGTEYRRHTDSEYEQDGRQMGPLLPNQEALTFEEVLKMCTIGGARSMGISAWTGSIEKGKLADLVVFAEDLSELAKEPESLCGVKPSRTYWRGKLVFGELENQNIKECVK